MKILTQFNVFRRKVFGIVGAPAVAGAATAVIVGWGVPAATTFVKGVPVSISMKVAIGAAVAVVLVTEAGFWFLGRDAAILDAENSKQFGRFGEALLKNPDLLKVHAEIHGKTAAQAKAFAELLVAAAAALPVSATAETGVETKEVKETKEAKATG